MFVAGARLMASLVVGSRMEDRCRIFYGICYGIPGKFIEQHNDYNAVLSP
jgi:hypothetical protein